LRVIVKRLTKSHDKKEYDYTEYHRENDDPQLVITLHLRHSLQRIEDPKEYHDVVNEIEIREHRGVRHRYVYDCSLPKLAFRRNDQPEE